MVKPLYNHDVFNFWLERNASSTRITDHNIYHGTFFIYLLWNIWCIRNLKVFQAAPFLASFAVSNASNQAIEWFFLAGPHSQSSRVKEVHISKEPPQEGWYKINSDGSCKSDCHGFGDIAAGGIIRNSNGTWMKGFACFLGSGTSLLVKLWAIYIGISIAKDANFDPIIVESDCLYAVNLINNIFHSSTHHYATMITMCRSKLASSSDFKVKHVLREGNFAADRLADFASHSITDLCVFDHMPSFLCNISLFRCLLPAYCWCGLVCI